MGAVLFQAGVPGIMYDISNVKPTRFESQNLGTLSSCGGVMTFEGCDSRQGVARGCVKALRRVPAWLAPSASHFANGFAWMVTYSRDDKPVVNADHTSPTGQSVECGIYNARSPAGCPLKAYSSHSRVRVPWL